MMPRLDGLSDLSDLSRNSILALPVDRNSGSPFTPLSKSLSDCTHRAGPDRLRDPTGVSIGEALANHDHLLLD